MINLILVKECLRLKRIFCGTLSFKLHQMDRLIQNVVLLSAGTHLIQVLNVESDIFSIIHDVFVNILTSTRICMQPPKDRSDLGYTLTS